MKTLFFCLALLIIFLNFGPISFAGKNYTNHRRIKQEAEAYRLKIKEIPIYREKIEGEYTLLGPVRGQDMLTNKRSAIIMQMRDQAQQMGANAIMEFSCDKVLKKTLTQCEGFAIQIP